MRRTRRQLFRLAMTACLALLIACGLGNLYFGNRFVAIAAAKKGRTLNRAELAGSLNLVGSERLFPDGSDVRYRDASWSGFVELQFQLPGSTFDAWSEERHYQSNCFERIIEVEVEDRRVRHAWSDCCSVRFDQNARELVDASVNGVPIDAVDVLFSRSREQCIVFIHTAAGR
jgi:hypothetical protein